MNSLNLPNSITETDIPGCFILNGQNIEDLRGSFFKVFNSELFEKAGIETTINEVFFSRSHRGVVRGMHFQSPPFDLVKIVSCISGHILDVILDLRKKSPSYGQTFSIELTPQNAKTVIVPKGCAHGFYAIENNSIVGYLSSKGFNQNADCGVLWNSFGFNWPNPIDSSGGHVISARDRQLPPFGSLESPFG